MMTLWRHCPTAMDITQYCTHVTTGVHRQGIMIIPDKRASSQGVVIILNKRASSAMRKSEEISEKIICVHACKNKFKTSKSYQYTGIWT